VSYKKIVIDSHCGKYLLTAPNRRDVQLFKLASLQFATQLKVFLKQALLVVWAKASGFAQLDILIN